MVPTDDPTYGYLVLFATEHTDDAPTADDPIGHVDGSRDLAVVRVRRDFETLRTDDPDVLDPALPDTLSVLSRDDAYDNRLRWLTDYEERSGGVAHVERPKLVALGGGRFVALWERWERDVKKRVSTYTGTWAMVLDRAGRPVGPATDLGDHHLPRGDDAFTLEVGGAPAAAWLTGDRDARALRLHQVTVTGGVPSLRVITID